jgi:hypothetical protein
MLSDVFIQLVVTDVICTFTYTDLHAAGVKIPQSEGQNIYTSDVLINVIDVCINFCWENCYININVSF